MGNPSLLINTDLHVSPVAVLHYLLPPRHQFLKLTQVYRLFLGMMCRFILVVKQHKVIKSSSLWCCVVNVNRHRRAQLASYSNSFSFTLGWLTLACPLHSSVSLHHLFFLLTYLSVALFSIFPLSSVLSPSAFMPLLPPFFSDWLVGGCRFVLDAPALT